MVQRTSDNRINLLLESFLQTLNQKQIENPAIFDWVQSFSGIPIDIFGTVYENFRSQKPAERKADGVYYTPKYIVDYIIENTVGKLVKGKTPQEVTKIKIVDPACGCGVFLWGAYQFLLGWHKDYYTRNKHLSKESKNSLVTSSGELTLAEKKRILLNNIFGVDIDVNAVEIAKFSLLLKCMEGETSASVENTQRLFHTKVLPSIDDNILVGNSLIDTDYYELPLEDDDTKKIKPFNWRRAFPQVFSPSTAGTGSTGFDAVIGNPPYVMLQMLSTRNAFNYCLEHFVAAKYKIDTYQLFLERGIQLLTKRGKLGVITPNTYLKNIHAEQLRKLILAETVIKNIVVIQHNVFGAVSVDTSISIFEKGQATKRNRILVSRSSSLNADKEVSYFEPKTVQRIRQYNFTENVRYDFNLFISESDKAVLDKIAKNAYRIGMFCDAYFGIQTFDREQYVTKTKRGKNYQPAIDGANI
ncbi:hypothetical protein FACS189427_13240 [Planctomycetales bacterium]|nr:hypothetical protein FACS189427_13240 [Planctomycetales bacterium]